MSGCCGGGSSVSNTFTHVSAPGYHSSEAPSSYGGSHFQTNNVTTDASYPDHRYQSDGFRAPTGDLYKTTAIVGPEKQVCATSNKGGVGSFLTGLFNFLR